MITHSESIKEIMAAILAVQKDVDHVEKTATNPHYGNSYADLNTFLHALRGPLADHGIVMTQGPGMEGETVVVDTLLYHESGEWLRDRAAAPMQKADPQGVGSAITYLRRYSLAALFAVPQEDDDGNAASQTPARNGGASRSRAGQTGPTCPKCEASGVWDNRKKKASGEFNERSPDYACKDKEGCGWTLWLDDATAKVTEALDKLVTAGVIDDVDRDVALSKVQGGELHAIAEVNEYIRDKRAQGATVGP